MKAQVIHIHGGDSFNTHEEYMSFLKNFEVNLDRLRQKGWIDSLQEELGDDFEVLRLRMPCKWNAKYPEWKLWFEKYTPLLNDEVVLVGHSLGGIFLAKYLSENKFPKKILGLFLVSAPYDYESDEPLGDFKLDDSVGGIAKQADEIFLYHSKDDDVVPFSELGKFTKALPDAHTGVFEDKGHFNQESFPELVRDIKKSGRG